MRNDNPNLIVLFKRLWQHISPRRRVQFGLLFLIMIFASLAEVISIGAVLPFLSMFSAPQLIFENKLVQPIIHFMNYTEPNQLLLPLTIAFSLAVLLSGAMRLLLLWAQTRLSFAIGADLSYRMYYLTLHQPYSVHLSRNSSEVISGIANKVSAVISAALIPFLTILSSVMMFIIIMAAIIAMNPKIAAISILGFGIIYAVIIRITKKRLINDSEQISRESNQVIKVIQEGLGAIRDVLIDGTQKTYCDKYRKVDGQLRNSQATITIITGTPRFGIEAFGMVLIAFLAYSLARTPEGLAGAIPLLGALALGAQRLLPILQLAYGSWACIRGGQASLFDTLELLDQPLPDYAKFELSLPIGFNKLIELNDISYRYNNDGPWVLKDLNLSILKGSRIGIVGKTGSGKSTLLDIIMGLIQPSEGNLLIDNVEINSKNFRSWQSHIAHVPQTIYLSDTTIIENIAFGVPSEKIDFRLAVQAAKKAQISDVIESWAHQYQTIVGERGNRLSGGQRQRIGIARALYKKADVIIFDEATSALDNDTEQNVIESILSLGDEVTLIIVAHRLSTLKHCDKVIEFSDKGIFKIGTFKDIVLQKSNL